MADEDELTPDQTEKLLHFQVILHTWRCLWRFNFWMHCKLRHCTESLCSFALSTAAWL